MGRGTRIPLTWQKHTRKISTGILRSYLTKTLMASQIDYSNTQYIGMFLNSIWKLQLKKNAVARVVTCTPLSVHVMLLLYKLHYLPVCFWDQFKILVMTYKLIEDMDWVSWGTASPWLHLPIPWGPAEEACYGFHILRGVTWWGQRRDSFLPWYLPFGTSFTPGIRLAPILLAFQKALRSGLCYCAWASGCGMEPIRWLHWIAILLLIMFFMVLIWLYMFLFFYLYSLP